jgi:DNA gyrase subunit B
VVVHAAWAAPDTRRFAHTAEERAEILQELEARKGSPLVVADEDDILEKREHADLVLHTIYEEEPIQKISEEVEKLHFSPKVFRAAPAAERDAGRKVKREPIAHLIYAGGDEAPVHDLGEILVKVKENVKGGTDVKRFKGLGEMNPDELFGTTMDPKKRTLLKVALKEVYKADEYFTILMGTNVESRRKFIQHHALDVKNLDI